MSRLTRDGTAEPVSRGQIFRRGRGQGNTNIFLVQLTTSRIGNLTRLIHTLAICDDHRYILAHIRFYVHYIYTSSSHTLHIQMHLHMHYTYTHTCTSCSYPLHIQMHLHICYTCTHTFTCNTHTLHVHIHALHLHVHLHMHLHIHKYYTYTFHKCTYTYATHAPTLSHILHIHFMYTYTSHVHRLHLHLHMHLHININRKERSKRPDQSKRPGALKIGKKTEKAEQTPRDALFYFILLENAPGRSFSLFFEKAPWGEPTTREGVRKGPAAEAERDASAACSGRNSTGIFFSLHMSQAFFLKLLSRPVDSTRPDQRFFSFWKRPGRRLLPYFGSDKRSGYVANAPGALFRNCFMERPGGRLLRSLRYYTYTSNNINIYTHLHIHTNTHMHIHTYT